MPKISDSKRAARRTQILEAAWVCFQKQGLHSTTMDDIIRTSGLSAGAVYSYFPSKEELILAAVTTSLSGLRDRVGPLMTSATPLPPDQLVHRIAEAISEVTTHENYDLKRIALLGWSEAQRNERLREIMNGFYGAFRTQLARVADEWSRAGVVRHGASSSDVAKAVLAVILGYVVQSAVLGDVEPADIARGLRDVARAEPDDGP